MFYNGRIHPLEGVTTVWSYYWMSFSWFATNGNLTRSSRTIAQESRNYMHGIIEGLPSHLSRISDALRWQFIKNGHICGQTEPWKFECSKSIFSISAGLTSRHLKQRQLGMDMIDEKSANPFWKVNSTRCTRYATVAFDLWLPAVLFV